MLPGAFSRLTILSGYTTSSGLMNMQKAALITFIYIFCS